MEADDVALSMSGGSYNSLYYQGLWQQTGEIAETQIIQASKETASFVYTAWLDAGEPPVPGSTVDVTPEPEPYSEFRLTLAPNPFSKFLSVHWDGPGPYTVEIFNIRGARVAELDGDGLGGGVRVWRPASPEFSLAPGMYLVRLRAPGYELVERAVFIR